mgnify:CR=1 FL=1
MRGPQPRPACGRRREQVRPATSATIKGRSSHTRDTRSDSNHACCKLATLPLCACTPAWQATAFVAPSPAVEVPFRHAVQPGAGLVALPAGDQVPLEQTPHVALRPKPALQMGTAVRVQEPLVAECQHPPASPPSTRRACSGLLLGLHTTTANQGTYTSPVQLALEVAPVLRVVLLAAHGVQLRLGAAAVPAAAQKPRRKALQDTPPLPAAQMATASGQQGGGREPVR